MPSKIVKAEELGRCQMKQILEKTEGYIKEMNFIDVALLKVCLASLGVLIGIAVPQKHKKTVAAGASVVYAITYAPLMTKYIGSMIKKTKE